MSEMGFNERLGKVLAQRRLEGGHSQEDIGKILGLTQTQVSRFEQGKQSPRLDTLRKLADFYRCAMAEIIDDAEHFGWTP